jgi:hypothetical protein
MHAQNRLLGLVKAVSLGTEARGGRARLLEVSADGRGQERSENELGTPEGREREPEEEDELEDKVKGEPVDDLDEALDHSEQSENDPVSQPLSIILLVVAKQRTERVVGRNNEASKVGKKLTAEVEDDEEEVESTDTNGSVGLRYASGPLEVVKGGVLGQLAIELRKVLLSLVLSGHFGG